MNRLDRLIAYTLAANAKIGEGKLVEAANRTEVLVGLIVELEPLLREWERADQVMIDTYRDTGRFVTKPALDAEHALLAWLRDEAADAIRAALPSPAAPDPEAVERQLTVGEALRDLRVRAGTRKVRVEGQLVLRVIGDVLMESRWHESGGRHPGGWWTGQRPAQLDLADLDAVCTIVPLEAP